jgi:hypothetical protein
MALLACCFGLVSRMGAYSKTIGQVSRRFTEAFISIVVWNVLEVCYVFPSWLVSGRGIFYGKIFEAGVFDCFSVSHVRCPPASVSDTPVFWRLANCGLYLLGDMLFPVMLLPCRRLYYFHISNNVNGTSIHTVMYFDLMWIDCCWTSGIR